MEKINTRKLTEKELRDALAVILKEHPQYTSLYNLIMEHCEYSYASYYRHFGGKEKLEWLAKDIKASFAYKNKYPVKKYGKPVLLRWSR